MTIPRFNELFTGVLTVLCDGSPHKRRDVLEQVEAGMDITEEERGERLKSGYLRAQDRVHWAIAYLVFAEAVSRPDKGVVQITDVGKKLLASNPSGVTLEHIEATDGYRAWQKSLQEKQAKKKSQSSVVVDVEQLGRLSAQTPSEELERSIDALRREVASEVLLRLRTSHWQFLERAVLKVLLGLGYGADEDDLLHVGKPGDEGVDGIINQDKLGLDRIYVQTKRYQDGHAINGNDLNAFMGAMSRKGVTKGVFITASHFADSARKAVEENKHQQVILIDGEELADIMVEHQIGVTEVQSYSLYKVDENFFEEN